MPAIHFAIYPKGKLDATKTAHPSAPVYSGRVVIEAPCPGVHPLEPINAFIRKARADLERIIADNPKCTTFD
jgi:hypothetical protein